MIMLLVFRSIFCQALVIFGDNRKLSCVSGCAISAWNLPNISLVIICIHPTLCWIKKKREKNSKVSRPSYITVITES